MSAAKLLLRLGKKALWNPMDLGPNVLSAWWNSDLHGNTTYMTDDGSGLISSFSSLNSKSAVTAATSARPTWTSTAWDSTHSGLTLDGTANNFVSTSFAALPAAAVAGEMWALFTDTAASGIRFIAEYGSGASTATNRGIRTNGSVPRTVQVTDGTTTFSPAGAIEATGGNIVGGNWSGTAQGFRLNGVDQSTGVIATLNTSTTRFRIGARNVSSADDFHSGVIRHIIVTTTLTTAQRQQMEGWLAWDGWSTAAANPLPVTHPYKYSPP